MNKTVCNDKQKRNKDKCKCECLKIEKCKGSFSWNLLGIRCFALLIKFNPVYQFPFFI